MKKNRIYQVDAFTESLFSGNPAAVCPLEEWMHDDIMQLIAAENNLAETAFFVPQGDHFEIRWFTPTVEVDLCGHATLASAFVLFSYLGYSKNEIRFKSPRSGDLRVYQKGDILFLDFPNDTLERIHDTASIAPCIGLEPTEVYKGRTDFLAVVKSEEAVQNLLPDLGAISRLPGRGLIVTAEGVMVDFVSRFFAPQSGVDEDPVTGSAHTSLIPLWSQKLGKDEMTARQLSSRGGELICFNKGERCLIGGKARLYMTGELNLFD